MSSLLPALSVVGSGLVTSVGFNAPSSLAAMRAGIRNVRETNLWDATTGEYIAAGKVDLPQWSRGADKWADLVAPAVSECLMAAMPVPPSEIPVLLVLPPLDRPHLPSGVNVHLLEEISARLGRPLHPGSAMFAGDRVALLAALTWVQRWLSTHPARFCVVAGVDSFVEPKIVEHYRQCRRILTTDNSNGFSPGEAGSAILVGDSRHPFTDEVQILGWGTGRELATPQSDEPLRGEGLIAAIGEALQASGIAMPEIDYRIADLNGEHDRFKEMTFAMLRFERQPRESLNELWHPAEYVGEVGAAIGPMLLATALHAGRKGYGVGPTSLCTLSNDDGARGCIVARYRNLADRDPLKGVA
jgi:3-oxoacyl-[acyl-carrier-protein] synthase I